MEENMNIEMNEELLQDFRNMENVEDGIQTTFNEDSLEEMNDESVVIENENEEEVEGIGAVGFSMRTTKPSGNLNFMTTSTGGWSTCIMGSPNDPNATVLSNCVGYASSRFNEIINLARGTSGCTYKTLNCNAENFIERAIASGLSVISKPCVGSILVWEGAGSLAGHVAIVTEVVNDNCIRTAESGYGSSSPFWTNTRYNNNGRWGQNSNYSVRGFIVNPNYPYNPQPTPPTPDWPKYYTVVSGDTLSGIAERFYGNGDYNHYMCIANANGIANPSLIYPGQNLTIPEYTEPAPTPTPGLQVGDTVKIIGTGNGSSYGCSNTAYGIGWTRQILDIWEGRAYPYQVGNSSGTTGFYKADALQKL
jgi:LysM repeat protein